MTTSKALLPNFKTHIEQNFSFLLEAPFIIAISGGIDSVVLTYLCYKLNLNFSLAHCNFKLRDTESDADAVFVKKMAEKFQVPFYEKSWQTKEYAIKNGLSIQMAARELRYTWLEELTNAKNNKYVLTAHQADDNLETFFINFLRGTGLQGLLGIPEQNRMFCRPLLPFSRIEIKEFAKQNALKWREDTSNKATKYLRNKLRLEILPKLKEIQPELLSIFTKNQANLQEAYALQQDAIERVRKNVLQANAKSTSIDILRLQKEKNAKAYLYELLKPYGFTAWNDVYHLLDAQTGKQLFSNTYQLLKNRNHLILTKRNTNVTNTIFKITTSSKKTKFPQGTLSFSEVSKRADNNQHTIYVDKNLLKFPLVVRKKQKGDYFYPLGMQGKKKISKYFKDEKLSLYDKENTWLLCTAANEIIWIIKYRADQRFKVSKSSKNILKIDVKE